MTPTSLSTSDAENKLTVNSSIKAIISMKQILFLNLINFTSEKQKNKIILFLHQKIAINPELKKKDLKKIF